MEPSRNETARKNVAGCFVKGRGVSSRGRVLRLGGRFVVLHAKDEIGRFLRLRRGLHDQGLVIAQLLKPACQIGG